LVRDHMAADRGLAWALAGTLELVRQAGLRAPVLVLGIDDRQQRDRDAEFVREPPRQLVEPLRARLERVQRVDVAKPLRLVLRRRRSGVRTLGPRRLV